MQQYARYDCDGKAGGIVVRVKVTLATVRHGILQGSAGPFLENLDVKPCCLSEHSALFFASFRHFS